MPSFSFFKMIFKSWWTRLAPTRSQSHGSLIDTIPFSPTYITRMRSFRSAHNQYSNDHLLPLYMNASSFELETLRLNTKNSSSLSKLFIGLAFQAALAQFQTISSPSSSSGSSSKDLTPFFGAAMVIAFAASLSGYFLSQSNPRLAALVERAGCFCFTIGLFVMTKTFLSGSLVMKVMGWLAGAFPMLAFLRSCLA